MFSTLAAFFKRDSTKTITASFAVVFKQITICSIFLRHKRPGPAAVLVNNLINLGHDADGLVESDDYSLSIWFGVWRKNVFGE